MNDLDLFLNSFFCSQSFIPVRRVGGAGGSVSIHRLIKHAEQIEDVVLPPVQRLAVLRLLLAVMSKSGGDASKNILSVNALGFSPVAALYGPVVDSARFEPGFLQVVGLPASSARNCRDVLDMRDENGMALDPTPPPKPAPERDALALLTSYFCDRPGLKARVSGLSISGQCPLHMGRTTVYRSWENLAEFMVLNWIPEAHAYLMHRWRRLELVAPGQLVIAPGDPWLETDYRDPWVLRKCAPVHQGRAITGAMVADDERAGEAVQRLAIGDAIDTTGVALSQASPLAIWQERGLVVDDT